MIKANWIRKLIKKMAHNGPSVSEYWESEGLCRIEKLPPTVVRGPSGGPALVSAQREYCVRR
ncbi:MAG: hypothetical protein WCC94_07765 [Candidatus Bathyarchaeia archaeon]